jgi:hypothetical protein
VKVKKFFIIEKVDRETRHTIPLVVDRKSSGWGNASLRRKAGDFQSGSKCCAWKFVAAEPEKVPISPCENEGLVVDFGNV